MNTQEPLQVGQPTLALAQSIVTNGTFPSSSGGAWSSGTAASLGMVITTAFDPGNVDSLTPTQGQLLPISSKNAAMFSLLRNTYGGNLDQSNYALPDLGAKAAQFITAESSSSPLNGRTVGSPDNELLLATSDLPASLGGQDLGVDNRQDSLGIQYLVKVTGEFPAGHVPTIDTLGMVYPFAGLTPGGTPDGFLPADGRLLNISEHVALFAVLGNTYGGNGRTTFALPDLRNHVPVGAGLSTVTGSDKYIALGEQVGDAAFNLSQAQLPVNGAPAKQHIDTMQPSLGMHYLVSTTGIYEGIAAFESTIGQILLYAGQRVPDGWILAHGQELPINGKVGYEALFSLIGTTFGGNGTTTFALPDLRGRTVVGTGGEQNLSLGETQGSFTEQITMANLPEIVVPVPGVHMTDESGRSVTGTVTGKFELDISGVWPQARVEYSTDGSTWTETYTAQEGSNTLFVRQVNVLGQASQPTNPINFVLDATAPEAPQVVIDGVSVAASMAISMPEPMFKASSLSSLATDPSDNETVLRTPTGKLSFGNVEDGAELEFSVDGGQTWRDSFEAQAGLNAVQVRQIDVAGNVSPASEVIRFYWDGSDTDPALTSTATHSTGGNVITVEQHGALSEGLGTDAIDLLIHGHQQDITLPADVEHIRLTENGLNNTVIGNAQDNVFEVVMGNWVIDGQSGDDTVKLANALSDYVISQESFNGELQATLYGPEGKVVVRGVQTIEFTDAILTKAEGAEISEVDHLYEEVLGRNPDPEGLTYWVKQMSQGAILADVAQAFAQSAEFKRLYGTPSEEQLVQELYEAILGRDADAPGLSYWTEKLVVHDMTEGQLIVSLMQSAESQAASMSQVSGDGMFVMA